MTYLMFVFSGFWIWAGHIVMIFVIGQVIVEAVKAIRPKRTISTFRNGDHWSVSVYDATTDDITEVYRCVSEEPMAEPQSGNRESDRDG